MQNSALAGKIVRLTGFALAVSYSCLAQKPSPTDWTLYPIRASVVSKVTTDQTVPPQIDGGCSGPYLILRISLTPGISQFNPGTDILLNVDGRPGTARFYDADDSQHKNNARGIFFVDGGAKEGLTGIGGIGNNGGTSQAAIRHNVEALLDSILKIGIAGLSAGTLSEVYRATSIQMQLPLSTGPLLIEIRPQDDPAFRRFKTACPSTEKRAAPAGQLSASKQFHGTVDAFLAELPGFVQRAAEQARVDSRAYEGDIAAMTEIIRTCAEITPEMIKSVKDRYRLVHLVDLRARYKPCAAGQSAKASFSSALVRPVNSGTERSIEMYIHNLEDRPAPFTVSVGFTDLPGDPPLDPATAAFNSPKYIVMGTIR